MLKYGEAITQNYQDLREKHAKLRKSYARERNERSETEEQLAKSRARVTELELAEKSLNKWKQKEPAIKHYLSVVTDMAK